VAQPAAKRTINAAHVPSAAEIKDSFQSADIPTQYPDRNAGHRLKHTRLAISIAGITTAFCFSGCVTSGPRQVAVQPSPHTAQCNAVVSNPPASRPPIVARPALVEQVVPEPNDIYISAAANSDVVFVGGSTYIWVTGPDGQRHRHFYGHGDRRVEIFRRRENLRSVAAPRPRHPATTHFAAREHGREANDAHHPPQLRVKATPAHGQPPQRHLASNNQSHHPVQHVQQEPKQKQILHEASTGNSDLPRRP
jgi:hypothetical protein